MTAPDINLTLAWAWILAGFGSGAWLGLHFAREDWLGGYTSWRRRMYRLAHIAFFGMAFVNLMFFLTARSLPEPPAVLLKAASALFVLGAATMPAGCLVLAHRPTAKPWGVFSAPVGALLVGGGLTFFMWIKK